jgi:hypothetical protein
MTLQEICRWERALMATHRMHTQHNSHCWTWLLHHLWEWGEAHPIRIKETAE